MKQELEVLDEIKGMVNELSLKMTVLNNEIYELKKKQRTNTEKEIFDLLKEKGRIDISDLIKATGKSRPHLLEKMKRIASDNPNIIIRLGDKETRTPTVLIYRSEDFSSQIAKIKEMLNNGTHSLSLIQIMRMFSIDIEQANTICRELLQNESGQYEYETYLKDDSLDLIKSRIKKAR